jgi:phosphoesterase RecJ-like protein
MSTANQKIQHIIDEVITVVIIQADNPDADSLGSALALEQILGAMGKQPYLYCGVEIPGYLRYLSGWDRVSSELPKQFDASIIVDASTTTLLEKLQQSGQQAWVAAKPCIVLDHHATVDHLIPYATVNVTDGERSSTGELIYVIAKELQWPLGVTAQTHIMTAILGDTQGLSNQLAKAQTYKIMGEMIAAGVDRATLEEARRAYSKMPAVIYKYKARLIDHSEITDDGSVICVTVPQIEINQYSPLYNPGPLIQGDMLQVEGVRVAIVFKSYDDGKVTAAIRCNPGAGIGALLASHFGGGGHDYASGFKVTGSRPFEDIKAECLSFAQALLDNLEPTDAAL